MSFNPFWPLLASASGALLALSLAPILRMAGAKSCDIVAIPRAYLVEFPLYGLCIGLLMMSTEPVGLAGLPVMACLLLAFTLVQVDAMWFYLPHVISLPLLLLLTVGVAPDALAATVFMLFWIIGGWASTTWLSKKGLYAMSVADVLLLPAPFLWFGFTIKALTMLALVAPAALIYREFCWRQAAAQFEASPSEARRLVPLGAALLTPLILFQLLCLFHPELTSS
jgi:hypothetical protein